MTLSDNYAPVRQIGDGATVDFTGNWNMINSSFARVFLESVATGVLTPVDEGGAADEYTIVFNTTGFTVTFNTAPTSSFYVVIAREVSVDQNTPYKTSKGFDGVVTENSFDKLTAICQDLQEQIDRAPTSPVGSSALVLPIYSAGLVPYWSTTTSDTQVNSTKTMAQIEAAVDAVAALSAASGVKVSDDDTTVGFLDGKLLAGSNVSFVVGSPGADETLTLNVVVDELSGDLDVNGFNIVDDDRGLLTFSVDGSAVNNVQLSNTATGSGPAISAIGDDTNIDLNLVTKGTGVVRVNDAAVAGPFLLETITASNAASVDFEAGNIDDTYSKYVIEFYDLTSSVDGADFWMRTSSDGGSSYDSGASDYSWAWQAHPSADNNDLADSEITLATSIDSTDASDGQVWLRNPSGTSHQKKIGWSMERLSSGAIDTRTGAGVRFSTSAIDAIRFLANSGNISGTFKLYGIK